MPSQSAAQEVVARLVQKYDSEKNTFEEPNYNEARTRQDFINPLFKLLGWDMDNDKRLSQSFREVLYEDKVSIDGNIKHPDYSFRIGKTVLFYVEAKKPSVNIKDNKEAALQLRYYGWNTGLTLSILTNFREFAVYDCRVKPDHKDHAHAARLTYFTYKDLLDSQTKFSGGFQTGFDFLAKVFVQENILRGSFDKFIQDDGDRFKKGVITIDQSFLQTLEDWRLILAKSLCKTNKEISEHDLNDIVSAILNRIVFLRFAEGREIEPFGQLKKSAETLETFDVYKQLFTLFERADEKYNSGLFDLNKDSQGEHLLVENNVLKRIVGGLYYPNPYAFDIIPVEILGSVYERFLGSVVRLTPGHHAVVEPKPEVRKAGGVFYTPQYIINYIVEHTIGELTKDKTPAEVAKIKVIDPSCGSGSFLLGAYQYLLDWHKNYYTAKYVKEGKTSKGLKNDTLTPFGELATTVKKQILINNIFGVDIDENAVEITKLSLLIKCLEGETTASIENTRRLFQEKVLPNIDNNIVSGNALIDTDFYNYEFGESVERLVKPFNWQRAFPQVFKQGGFDAVIGNPPYVSIRTLDFNTLLKPYYKEHFKLAVGQYDLYALFIERAAWLLNQTGKNAMIVSKRMATNENFESLRRFLLSDLILENYADSGMPFSQCNVETNILISTKQPHRTVQVYRFNKEHEPVRLRSVYIKSIHTMPFFIFPFMLPKETMQVLHKIQTSCHSMLGDYCSIIRGFECGFNHPSVINRKGKYPIIRGENIRRYCITPPSYSVKPDFNDSKVFKTKEVFLTVPKLVTKFVSNNIEFALDTIGYCNTNVVYNVHVNKKIDLLFLLGVLNSGVVNFWFRNVYVNEDIVFPHIQKNQLESIPFPAIDLSQKSGKDMHDKIVRSVNELLELYSRAPQATFAERKRIEGKIAHFENEINQTVYRLYDLTAEEIAIVEEAYKTH